MSRYKDKKVAILGLSVEGIDSAHFFASEQAVITCCDRQTKEELGETYTKLKDVANDFRLGTAYLSNLSDFDILVRTPGMSLRTPQLENVRQKGIPITSLTRLFFANCPAPIIGVTGTKGKGTTATLIYEMLRKDGRQVWLGGNVGVPLLSKVHEIKASHLVVVELSSFQLEDMTQSPHIAVVLKITQDHLANFDPHATNYHRSKEEYVDAKKSIVRYQNKDDMVIVNSDDPTSMSFAKETPGSAYYFSRSNETKDAYIHGKTVYVRRNGNAERICDASEVQLLGMHNLEDIAAASLASTMVGVSISSIRKAAISFKGLEHRLEFIRSVGGVSYYNDSFSTVPETTIAAIQSFETPIILIVGGSEKCSEYRELGKEIARSKVKALIAIGVTAKRIIEAVTTGGYKGIVIPGLRSMHDVVAEAAKRATSGDVVILSPACASFDMFKNYKERGKLFKHEVSLL